MKRLKQMDIVTTKFNTFAVVAEVNSQGHVSLVLPEKSTQKIAWYAPEELKFIASFEELVNGWFDHQVLGYYCDYYEQEATRHESEGHST